MFLSEAATRLLITQAIRFDGYQWALAQGAPDDGASQYLNEHLLRPFRESGRIPADPAAALALNFGLHRNFYHGGFLPDPGSPDWGRLCLLYLHTYRLPTPPAFRHAAQAEQWEARPKGSAEALAAKLRQALLGA